MCIRDSNVGATAAAIKGLASDPANIILIAGGDAKGADLSDLRDLIQQYVKTVSAFGQDGPQFAAICGEIVPFSFHENLDSAFQYALSFAREGDLLLLSPACSSLDMYPNFEARGSHFSRLVRALCH